MIFCFESDVAKGLIFRGKRRERIHNFTLDADPGYNYVEKTRKGVQWYMMVSKDFFSSTSFELKNESNQLVSYNDQSVTF